MDRHDPCGIRFDEEVVRLDFDGDGPNNAHLKAHSPAGRVPVLYHGDLRIWESLAILEYVAELFPEKALWPDDRQVRARARIAANEMHAGFGALRSELPMNVRRTPARVGYTPAAQADIDRVQEIWNGCRSDHGADGPFLFGGFSIADAMYAPVVSRFAVYEIDAARCLRAPIWTPSSLCRPISTGRLQHKPNPG